MLTLLALVRYKEVGGAVNGDRKYHLLIQMHCFRLIKVRLA